MGKFEDAMNRNPHLKAYVNSFVRRYGRVPGFEERLSRDMAEIEHPNIIYPVGDPIFIHIYGDVKREKRCIVIEPSLNELEEKKYKLILSLILNKAPHEPVPKDESELKDLITKLLMESISIGPGGTLPEEEGGRLKIRLKKISQVPVTEEEFDKIHYILQRDIVGSGVLEPLMRDPYIEDIHSLGTMNIHIVHKVFGMIETTVRFKNEEELDRYLKNLGERIGRPVSDARPIVDGTMPDGSRINIVYSNDVSGKGPSFTIRKFSDVPIAITQLIKWGSISAEIAAYAWLCLENGMSAFVCGETASGKTTLLNALLSFIHPKSKILTAEDTPEVRPPHKVWQQLITRESGPPESRVEMFDLLRAALRSRPNYIIVGEIRGREGAVAFQAMQTGHPVLATFHASSVRKMIQRFTGDPINVPVTFIDNLNVVFIQQAVYRKGKFLRRCTSVEEIEGYFEEAGGVVTRAVFQWDSIDDVHIFRGMNNSYILENKIAERAGYEDKREIYDDLLLRAKILDEMVNREIFDYNQVNKIIRDFYDRGLEGIPFPI
jgi:flagellar protein FlaI